METGIQRTLSASFAPGTRPSSRAPSRPRNSRNSSRASLRYLPQDVESMAFPEGTVGAEATELLHEFVHPQHNQHEPLFGAEPHADGGEDEDDAASLEIRRKLPWYKRPSPYWFLLVVPFAAGATIATAAPRIELFTELACIAYKDKYQVGEGNKTTDSLVGITTLAGGLTDAEKQFCAKEPRVQAAVAQLNMALMLLLGILSCMTAGWWGSISDRYGRTRVLSIAVFGLLISDVIFLSTVHFHRVLPGGYLFLLLGPLLDGLCGGMTALTATIHAYLADCTDQEHRARVFSLFLGLTFVGFGIGPTIGSAVVHVTHSALSVFYIAAGMHMFYASMVWLVVPESLSLRRQLQARKLKREKDEAARNGPQKSALAHWMSKAFGFLAPLALFWPAAVDSNPLKRKRRDWNLFLLAVAYGSTILLIGSYTYKLQYTSEAFGWTSEQMGYWLSAVGVARAVHLTAILPLVIKFFKPRPKTGPVNLPSESYEDLLQSNADLEEPTALSPPSAQHSSLPFDLALAKVSLLVEVVSYTALCFAADSLTYTVFTMAGAFGSGFGPAVSSVALALYIQRGGVESGKLFGAMSVIQSLCSQIIGPSVFGTTYIKTVGTFPKAIFILAAGAVIFSFTILMFVRLPSANASFHPGEETAMEVSHEADETLVDPEVPLIIVDDVGGKSDSPSTSTHGSPAL
ncbi:major facilitator superfamily domain-containing protein [Irpex rosettiformis]|uniref:Major facilitator superfamily domain-containing protein n=1 Tax=Irpex rosettiformis TaxID=378272 RepID=A0ACB8UHT1_9APHY|nr:major facilitator superfamily domain-containing protein [Irpex rosettiformis]